jgi:hypothetical protein
MALIRTNQAQFWSDEHGLLAPKASQRPEKRLA